jgi:hypothetical protein
VLHAVRQSAGDVLAKVGLYACRPSRLLIAALLLPSHFPRLLGLLLSIMPVDWPGGQRRKALRLAVGNLVLLRHDRPEQAWQWMERVLRTPLRSTEEYFLGAVCLHQGLGRMEEAVALFARANARDFALASARRGGFRHTARARHPLAQHDRRPASDPQCRRRELFAGDRRDNSPRRICHPHARPRRAAVAAACQRHRLWRQRHALRLDGRFPSGAQPFRLAIGLGPDLRSALYGVPAVLTNWWPPGLRPWHASDIYIPKLPKRAADGTYLTLTKTRINTLSAVVHRGGKLKS